MISLEKWIILTLLQKLPNNVGNLGKIFVATGFEWLPKVQKTPDRSGHTERIVSVLGSMRCTTRLVVCFETEKSEGNEKRLLYRLCVQQNLQQCDQMATVIVQRLAI